MKKLTELYLMVENLQQADKIYFKTGRLSPMVRKIMIDKVTGGDGLTKKMCDLFWGEFQQDSRQGDWAINAINKNEKYDSEKIHKSDEDYKDLARWKKIKKLYQELKDYNKNVFPVIDYKENDVASIVQFNTSLKHRRTILDMFEQLPKIAKRNMKADIREPRDYNQMNKYRSRLEYFISLYSQLNNRDEDLKQNIIRKMFKSNTTLEDLLDFAEEKENLIGGADLTKNEIKRIIDEHYLEVIHSSDDKLVLEVTDIDAIKELGCNSLWCFTYNRRGGGANYQDWSQYSYNSIVYVFIDFSVPSDDKDFMYVLVEPLNFFPENEEEEEKNDHKLFSMDNNEAYNPLSIIDYFMGLEKGRKKLTFDMEPQPKPKEPKKKFKDPNQMEFQFEIKLIKSYEEILDEDYPPSFNMEEFKKLNSFNKRIKYCETNLKRISSGSSRIVYSIDDEKVLKLAKNQKGLGQNEIEIEYGQYHDLNDIVAKIFDYENNNLWVEMELARKLTVGDFKRIVGFDFKDYSIAVTNYGNQVNQQKNTLTYPKLDEDIIEEMWENEFIYDIFNFIGNYDLPVGDLTRTNSYGIVKRNGEDTIVIIDYGLTHEVYTSYYS